MEAAVQTVFVVSFSHSTALCDWQLSRKMCWLIDFKQINVIPQKFCIMSIIPTELISSLQLGELYFSLASHLSFYSVTCSHQRAGMQDNNWPCLLWSKELSHPNTGLASQQPVLTCCLAATLAFWGAWRGFDSDFEPLRAFFLAVLWKNCCGFLQWIYLSVQNIFVSCVSVVLCH